MTERFAKAIRSSCSPAGTRAARARCCEVLGDGQVVVEGVNLAKKPHQAQPAGQQARRHHREGDAHARPRRWRLWNPGAKKADRVGIKTLTDGKKVRFFKSNGEMLDV